MRRALLLVALLLVVSAVVVGQEQEWEVVGEFLALTEGEPETAVFKLKTGETIRVPLENLSTASKSTIKKITARHPTLTEDGLNTVGPSGKTISLNVPSELASVEKEAIFQKTALAATKVYRAFLENTNLSPGARKAAEKRLAHWKMLAADNKVRLGDDWVTPAEFTSAEREAEKMILHCRTLIKLGSYKLAEKELLNASQLNPESGKANFMLGFVWSYVANNDTKGVEHFTECVRREPDNGWAYSNLAVCEIFTGKGDLLVEHFQKALSLLPDRQIVADNIGKALAMQARKQVRIPSKVLVELSDLYRMALEDLGLTKLQDEAQLALTYVSPYGVAWDGKASGDNRGVAETPEEEVTMVGSGSGVIIAPGWVLTNNHVVKDATKIEVLDPKDKKRKRMLPATLVASSEQPDLALLRCESLAGDAISLRDALPRRGSDIMTLGYPLGARLGMILKSSRGAIIAQADPELPVGGFLHSATTNGGNSGGPIVDQTGRLVGLVVAFTTRNFTENAYSIGIPAEQIWPFVKNHLPDLKPDEGNHAALEWPDVDAKVSPGTVYIECIVKPQSPSDD